MTDMTANSTTEISCPQCGAPVVMPGYADAAVCAFCGSTLTRERELGAASHSLAASALKETAQAVSAPDEEVLHSVQCSQCAGPLSVREGRRILVCGHCGVRVAVKEHGGFTRWYFPPRVNRLKAAAAGAAWLRDYPGVARHARDARFLDAHLIFAPIWEHKALLAGWEFGHVLKTETELVPMGISIGFGSMLDEEEGGGRLELKLVEKGVKEPRLQERRYYQAATDLEALGAIRPRFTGRELLLPLLAGELDPSATVLEAEGTAAEAGATGRAVALAPLSGAMSPDSHLFAFRESLALLYYPLWVVRFEAGDRICRVLVSGRDGSVNSAVAPGDNSRRVRLLALQVAAMAIVVAFLVLLAVTQKSGRVSMVAAAVIVSVIAILSTWRFRAVGEVEYHEPFSG
jgi:hypothetical protein